MIYTKGSFTVVPNIQALQGQSPYTQTLYLWICYFTNQDGQCWPSIRTLMQKTKMSKMQIHREIKKLEQLKILKKTNRFVKKNVKTSSNYEIIVNDLHKPSEGGGSNSQIPGGSNSQIPQELYPDSELNNTHAYAWSNDGCAGAPEIEKNLEPQKTETPEEPEEFGNEKINILDKRLKESLGITDWRDKSTWQRKVLWNMVKLADKLGHPEFLRRVERLKNDDFHRKNSGSLDYLYRTIRSMPALNPTQHIPSNFNEAEHMEIIRNSPLFRD